MILAMYVPTLFALGIVVMVRLLTGIRISHFTEDPAQIMGAPFYVGILSNVGVLLWCSCAAICYFASRALAKAAADREWRLYFFAAGIVTTILLVDDFFQVHEQILRNYLHVPEKAIFGSYVIMMVWLMAKFWKTIMKTDFLLLLLAYGLFALSLIFDLMPHGPSGHYLLEDGAKLAGIVTWFTYFARVASREVAGRLGGSNRATDPFQ